MKQRRQFGYMDLHNYVCEQAFTARLGSGKGPTLRIRPSAASSPCSITIEQRYGSAWREVLTTVGTDLEYAADLAVQKLLLDRA